MTTRAVHQDLDLTLQRIIRAPRRTVWRAWTDPALLEQWWTPAPTLTRVDQLDVRPGGGFVTRMSEDGREFVPHTDSVFLVVEDERRLVFTNAVDSALAARLTVSGVDDRRDRPGGASGRHRLQRDRAPR